MNSSRSRLAAVVYFLVAAPIALVVLSALPQHAAPQHPANEIVLGIDPAQSKVRWIRIQEGKSAAGYVNGKSQRRNHRGRGKR